MLNLRLGSQIVHNGKTCILTKEGAEGHAVYGPYEQRPAGKYAVEFNVAVADPKHFGDDPICAILDVTAAHGSQSCASRSIRYSDLQNETTSFILKFKTDKPHTLEYRVFVTGKTSLIVDNTCQVVSLSDQKANASQIFDINRFPNPAKLQLPEFFVHNADWFRSAYDDGALVRVVGNNIVLTINGVSFFANSVDDIRFVGEIFYKGTYNIMSDSDMCIIDIGMNIGLVSMLFALDKNVKEIHSFEPFKSTYKRALNNFALNPALAKKISPHNFGLAGADRELTVYIADESDSGAFSVRGEGTGTPMDIAIRNAGAVLRPIIENAKRNKLQVHAKVDCEGAEFDIFEVLKGQGLLTEISSFMVEWHRMFDDKSQQMLFGPLVKDGYVVFDLSGKSGNGFFYAVKSAANSRFLRKLAARGGRSLDRISDGLSRLLHRST